MQIPRIACTTQILYYFPPRLCPHAVMPKGVHTENNTCLFLFLPASLAIWFYIFFLLKIYVNFNFKYQCCIRKYYFYILLDFFNLHFRKLKVAFLIYSCCARTLVPSKAHCTSGIGLKINWNHSKAKQQGKTVWITPNRRYIYLIIILPFHGNELLGHELYRNWMNA